MEQTQRVNMVVNGESVSRDIPVRCTLVDFLRGDLELNGTHVGCEHGVCGACTVRLDGRIVRGCLMLAVQADGATVETIEGMTASGELAELQEAFHEAQRAAVRLLHAGHADDRRRAAPAQRPRRPARRSAVPRRQLLPLHRLSRHRRRHGVAAASAAPAGRDRAHERRDPAGAGSLRGYVGTRRGAAERADACLEGRGRYIDDLVLPRMVHVAFVRSPYAHARMRSIDTVAARAAPGVLTVATGKDIARSARRGWAS